MRLKLIMILRTHPHVLSWMYTLLRLFLNTCNIFVKKKNSILFTSYGGRQLSDSPYELYKGILNEDAFKSFEIYWAFVDPDRFSIPVGEKIKIDTIEFFKVLLRSRIWISNTGIDRDIGISKKGRISVETWHGSPIKKICGEENSGSVSNNFFQKRKIDKETIRCAQSNYDLEIFARVFNAESKCFLLSDLPRNDILYKGVSYEKIVEIKRVIGLPIDKKIILYMPTFREYEVDDKGDLYIKPPIHLSKWEKLFAKDYILLIRAHYAVTKAMDFNNNDFVKNVSEYSDVNDLYLISDLLISDYSSAYFDYSILKRPMLCFAYDIEKYSEKRGMYMNIEETLPCSIDKTEEELLKHIVSLNYEKYSELASQFHEKYTPYAGNATQSVIDEIIHRM